MYKVFPSSVELQKAPGEGVNRETKASKEEGDEADLLQTYLEGFVYGREMANTLAYCSAAKFL